MKQPNHHNEGGLNTISEIKTSENKNAKGTRPDAIWVPLVTVSITKLHQLAVLYTQGN